MSTLLSGTDKLSEPAKRVRFGEPRKFLPVVFVVVTMAYLVWAYVNYHLRFLLQLSLKESERDPAMWRRGLVELVVFCFVTTLLLISYVRCILVHPGEIPDQDPQWDPHLAEGVFPADFAPLALQELKKTGERRHCKWCGKYKPDRCHHCRVCKSCILKMDHHCPWIYNCVGFANYKYFFLLLFYSVVDTHLITWSMLESVKRCVDHQQSTQFTAMVLTFFTVSLSFFLMVLVTGFFGFHVRLTLKAMTTIEFCEEKTLKKSADRTGYETSVYDLGMFGNLRATLGDNVAVWFVPWSPPAGDGLVFVSDETRLTKDLEPGKGIRRRTHQRVQRPPRATASTDETMPAYGPFSNYGNYGSAAHYGSAPT